MENTIVNNKSVQNSKPMPPAYPENQQKSAIPNAKTRETPMTAKKKDDESSETEPKSTVKKDGQAEAQTVADALTANLSDESRETMDRVLTQANKYFGRGKEYINANPREAIGLAASIGIAAWALLCTKPGRQAFQAGAVVAAPHLKKWISENFAGAKA